MNMRKILMGLLVSLIFSASMGFLFNVYPGAAIGAAEETPPAPPPPSFFMKMSLSGICGNQDHLYVMAGGKVLQYVLSDLSLAKTVDLPEPEPPADAPPPPAFEFRPPPPMACPHGIWIDEHFLYVLAGPRVYEYSTPDLTLMTTLELPKPELTVRSK